MMKVFPTSSFFFRSVSPSLYFCLSLMASMLLVRMVYVIKVHPNLKALLFACKAFGESLEPISFSFLLSMIYGDEVVSVDDSDNG